MLRSIIDYLEKPKILGESEINFQNDKYTSENFLQAHLNTNFEGDDRKLKFIEKSVLWIEEMILLKDKSRLLDIGCSFGI